ncbi:hypothetical protein J3R30DRAFT_3281489 [Lentinula aciculospora]|uniref:Thioredoxin-like protein n=1 Tax=Lentinula aciculospora TaxID=153920 RepID=A0A9W9DTY3_9AGAR|nr:hypothetical protein J3R30DRAFT_3281489 [Lentinula aciculospora]
MPSPPIQVFLTTIASQPALRQRQEYLLRILQVKKIPFTSYDLASDETAKRLWKRKAPLDKQQLPGMLVGGKFPGVSGPPEEAVEYGELDQFLHLKETWDDELDNITKPLVQPIGVPGAMLPLQMTPDHLKSKILASPQSTPGKTPVPVNKPGVRDSEFDVSTELSGYGLQGIMATEAELADLVAELGLDGDEAGDLVKGLAGSPSAEREREMNTNNQAKESKDHSKEDPELKEVEVEKNDLKEKDADHGLHKGLQDQEKLTEEGSTISSKES